LNAKKVQCGDNFKQGSLVIKNLIDSANLSNRGNSTCLRPVVQGAKEGKRNNKIRINKIRKFTKTEGSSANLPPSRRQYRINKLEGMYFSLCLHD
jgi:hypothetical protein